MTSLRLQWPALNLTLTAHTVKVRSEFAAGYLARDAASLRDLGLVWASGTSWHWRTPDERHYGERSSQSAALQVLRDTHDIAAHGTPRERAPLLDDAPRHPAPGPVWSRPVATPQAALSQPAKSAVKPAPPTLSIIWPDDESQDLTASVAAALARHR